MRSTGGVNDESVMWTSRDDRRISLQGPYSEAFQIPGVLNWFGILDDEIGDQRLGFGHRHANAQTQRLGRYIGGENLPPIPDAAGQDQRRIYLRRASGKFARYL